MISVYDGFECKTCGTFSRDLNLLKALDCKPPVPASSPSGSSSSGDSARKKQLLELIRREEQKIEKYTEIQQKGYEVLDREVRKEVLEEFLVRRTRDSKGNADPASSAPAKPTAKAKPAAAAACLSLSHHGGITCENM